MSTGNSGTGGNIADRVVDDYSGYKVYDERGEKLGKVEYTILDNDEQPQYLGVNTGFFGTKTTLLPEEMIRLDDQDRSFSVQTSESRVKDAPTFDSHSEIDSAYEDRIREHYGLGTNARTGDERSHDESRHEEVRHDDVRHDEPVSEGRSHDRSRDDIHQDDIRHDDVRREETTSDGYDHGTSDSRDHSSHSGVAASGTHETRDTGEIEHHDESSRTGRDSGGDREQVRVTLKRQVARAERVINADGDEEVRIRKSTITEETLVDVEDPK